MSNNFSFSIFIVLLFLNFAIIKAQTIQKEKQPLITILKTLEKKYNISFSYVDETIKDKEATVLKTD